MFLVLFREEFFLFKATVDGQSDSCIFVIVDIN